MKILQRTVFLFLFPVALFQVYTLNSTPGDLDPEFGTNSVVIGIGDHIKNVAIQSDDSIVTVGTLNGIVPKILVARFSSNGAQDNSFNNTGSFILAVGTAARGEDVILQSDGKIITVGSTFQSQNNFIVARFTTAGALDTTFNTIGYITTSIGFGAQAHAVGLQSTGDIIAAGTAVLNSPVFAIARYTASGTLDGTFGTSGTTTTGIGINAHLMDIAIQTDDKIVAVGSSFDGHTTSIAVARYTASGSLDGTFGSGGIVQTVIGSYTQAESVYIQTDGNIVVSGYTIIDNVQQFVVARYTTTGVLDGTFGSGGLITTAIRNGSRAQALVLQTDGQIIAGGYSFGDRGRIRQTLARYSPTGGLDSSFGSGGVAVAMMLGGCNSDVEDDTRIYSLALQSSGNIISGGFFNQSHIVARYFATGGAGYAGPTGIVGCFPAPETPEGSYMFAYSTTTQTLGVANTFQNITFDTTPEISGWKTVGITGFVPNVTGVYEIKYTAEASTSTALLSSGTVASVRAVLDSVEIPGSQAHIQFPGISVLAAGLTSDLCIANSFIKTISPTGVLSFEFAGSNTSVILNPTGPGTTKPSITVSVTKIN